MMETPQNNPHHIYSVGDHTVHAVETIAPNPVLRLTMLLHDIAKPKTRTTDENGIDHFIITMPSVLTLQRLPSNGLSLTIRLRTWSQH